MNSQVESSLVVFAAGKGTRLRPLTDRTPKAMVPVLDVPLVELALRRGGSADWAARFVNVSGPAPGLREHLRHQHPAFRIFDEGEEGLGTAATLRCLLPELSATVVTHNCDLVTDLELSALLEWHLRSPKPCTLAVGAVESGADIEVEGGRAYLIDRRIEDRPGFLFLGAACFDKDLVGTIPPEQPLGLTKGLLERAFSDDLVGLFEHPGYAQDAGTLDRLLHVSLDALPGGKLDVGAPGMMSPAGWYRGPGAEAPEPSLGRGAIVLSGARVEKGARLKRCIVWPDSTVPAGAYLNRGIWFEDRFLRV